MIDNIKSILIINEGFSDNIGDQAIKESMEYLVNSELKCKYSFEDLSRYNKIHLNYDVATYTKKNSKIKPPNLFKTWILRFLWVINNFYRLKNACQKNDYAIIGGGQLLLANNIFPFEIFIWTLFLNLYKVKYSFFSVGTQGDFSKSDLFFLSYSLKHAKKIFVRDKLSKTLIKSNFDLKACLTYDTAFVYNSVINSQNFKSDKRVLLGVVDIKVYNSYNSVNVNSDNYNEKWYDLIKNYDIKKVNLFYSTKEDRFQCLSFQSYIHEKLKYKIPILENFKTEEFIKNLLLANLIISGRMHSLILAKTLNINYETFLISKKLIEFERIYKNLKNDEIVDDIKIKFKSIFQF